MSVASALNLSHLSSSKNSVIGFLLKLTPYISLFSTNLGEDGEKGKRGSVCGFWFYSFLAAPGAMAEPTPPSPSCCYDVSKNLDPIRIKCIKTLNIVTNDETQKNKIKK